MGHDCGRALKSGLCLIPEDRKEEGLNLGLSIRMNVSLASLGKMTNDLHLMDGSKEHRIVAEQIQRFRIKAFGDEQITGLLSGGNQQKVCLAKWTIDQPRVMLLDEPTKGIDIGAKEEMFRAIEDLTGNGVAVLFVSSEFPELLQICDRILVLRDGRIYKELPVDEKVTEELLMYYVTGGDETPASASPPDCDPALAQSTATRAPAPMAKRINMRYKLLGRSGLRVSELCLGALTFGTANGWGATKAESRAMFDAFAYAGGNFIDTANIYTGGTSEEYLGEFIADDRGRFVVSTKYSLSTRDGDPNFSGNHRKNMQSGAGGEPAAPEDRLCRRVLGSRLGLHDPRRGGDARARRRGPRRQGALCRHLRHARLDRIQRQHADFPQGLDAVRRAADRVQSDPARCGERPAADGAGDGYSG